MGVTGLWTVVSPCARPIKLETLNKKRLAVDASIWIYQFLKAVRDKEGNALRNSHIVGFFRRICKLLFFGIQPVFVFDGGAPILKRQTINNRKARREGRREDAIRTAGKLLAVQMQRQAEQDAERQRDNQRNQRRHGQEEEIPDAENLVYVSELGMSEQERKRARGFKKKDQYHLPELDADMSTMGAPNDPRVMSQEELEEYARQFHSGEDINLYDFSKIDFDSPFFVSLPASDRYNILNAARLRSRLRMGYSKDQLDTMFPDRMAFSRFQIERVRERNELTQRLMNLNGMNGDMFNVNGRIAGEKGREYVLVKNDGVEGGWVLGVVGNKEGERSKPIDVDKVESSQIKMNDDEWEDEEDFEDVPIEGLNRLPKPPHHKKGFSSTDDLEKRHSLYLQRREQAGYARPLPNTTDEEQESLFVADGGRSQQQDMEEDGDESFEDVIIPDVEEEYDDDLQRAIAMSLENDEDHTRKAHEAELLNGPNIDKPLEFNQKNAKVGRAFAQVANARANEEIAGPFAQESDEEDDDGFISSDQLKNTEISEDHGFSGPLPFESLSLGKSILGKKKKQDTEGGFEKEEEKAKPLPPWFSADLHESYAAQEEIEKRDRELAKANRERLPEPLILRRQHTREVIDLEDRQESNEVIELESSDEEDEVEIVDTPEKNEVVHMTDVANLTRIEPPKSHMPTENGKVRRSLSSEPDEKEAEWSESDLEKYERKEEATITEPAEGHIEKEKSSSPEFEDVEIPQPDLVSEIPDLETEPANKEMPDIPHDDTLTSIPDGLGPDDEIYSDPEDEELLLQMAAEAEEHVRFAASIAENARNTTAEDYERELRQLRNQQKKDRRDADEVTQVMITECQQLLKLFGLPYITAPMEAEAQCAELVNLGLVDGIVTDDSDIFLFGGTRVYKNMFNQAKFVECYLASDLEKEYSLTREKLIQAAHLLGSDYTEGLPSVGPVTAMEILSEFPSLLDFRDWWEKVQHGQFSQSDNAIPFRRKFKKNATKLFLPLGFPSPAVDQAYLHPEVDSDPSPFVWGVPDLDALRNYLMATIGWSRERADEILVPVIRDMNRREVEGTQANITRFFGGAVGTGTTIQRRAENENTSTEAFAPRRRAQGKSSRMETALGKLHARARGQNENEHQSEANIEAELNNINKTRKNKEKSNKGRKRVAVSRSDDEDSTERATAESGSDTDAYAPPRKAKKRAGAVNSQRNKTRARM
jgi:DNA excision repair protein ERCC-5